MGDGVAIVDLTEDDSIKLEVPLSATPTAASDFEGFHEAVLAQTKTGHKFRRKRARSRGKSASLPPDAVAKEPEKAEISVKDEVDSPVPKKDKKDEDEAAAEEAALRAAVLTSIAEKRTKKEEEKAYKRSLLKK